MTDFKDAVIALDLGGTKIACGLVLPSGEVIRKIYLPTLASEGPQHVIGRMLQAVNKLLQRTEMQIADCRGICLAVAGLIDKENGVVTFSPHLPGWHNVHIRQIFTEALGCRIYIINDASAAALGEYRYGAGIGFTNVIYLTISTGIGGGIIANGCLYEGTDGCAGEIGHMIVNAGGAGCYCGNQGCLEAMSSGTAITRNVISAIEQGSSSSILDLAKQNIENIDAKLVAKAAKNGDALALSAINQASYYLGIGLINLVHIFNPQLIIIGGGISNMGNLYLSTAREIARKYAFTLPAKSVRIVRAKLGRDSGIIGAASLAFHPDSGRAIFT